MIFSKRSTASIENGEHKNSVLFCSQYFLIFFHSLRVNEVLLKYEYLSSLLKYFGLGAFLRKGMQVSNGDYIVLCEPDSTFTSKDIYKFLAYIDDFDCIFGTRTTKSLIQKGAKMQFYLRVGNIAVAKFLEYLFFGPTLSDVGCTYKMISRNSYEKIKNKLTVTGSEFQPELMIRLILNKERILEIPVNYLEREGKSKITYNFFSSLKLALKMIFLIISLRIKNIF